MKKIILFCLAALLLLAGCSMNTAPTTGELCITINNGRSRSVTEGEYISSNVAYYRVSVFDSTGYYVDDLIPVAGEREIKKSYLLRSGNNWVNIYALNSDRVVLAQKDTLSYDVTPGTTHTADVTFTDSDLHGNLVIDIQNMDTTGDLYAKVFKISDDPNKVSDSDETINITSYGHANNSGQEYIQLSVLKEHETFYLSGGYYSVRIYNKVNDEYQFLNNLPVKIVQGNSYVSGYYKDGKLTFRPYLELSPLTSVESESDIYLRISNRADIESCTLYYSDSSSVDIKSIEGDISYYGNSTSVRFKNFDLHNSEAISKKLWIEYTVKGDKEVKYFYDFGNVTVNPCSPLEISYYENGYGVDKTTFAYDTEITLSVYKQGSVSIGDNYEVKWFISGTEYAPSVHDNSLKIKTINFESKTYDVVAEVRNKNTGVIKKATSSFTIDSSLTIPTRLELYTSGYNSTDYSLLLLSSQPVNVYLCDENGYKVQKLAEELKKNEEKFIGIPSAYQYGCSYTIAAIPVDKDNDNVMNARDYVVKSFPEISFDSLIDISLSSPSFGVFTAEDKPCIIVSGLNHFVDKFIQVTLNDVPFGNQSSITTGDSSRSYGIINSSRGTNNARVQVKILDSNGNYNATRTYYYQYLYEADGLAGIQVDKVYQAYVMDSVNVGGENNSMDCFIAEYRTLMLKEDKTTDSDGTYYLLTAHVDDGMMSSMIIGSGSYKENDDHTINLACTKYTSAGPEAVEGGITAKIVSKNNSEKIVIDDVEYDLLNKTNRIPNPNNQLEGAWKLRTIAPTADLLNKVVSKYLAGMLPPGVDLLKFNEGEGIAVDVNVSIADGQFSAAVLVDADASALNNSVSLAEDFVPYAILSGELVGKGNNIVEVAGFSVPVALSTTTDGSVLNILYYFDKDHPVVISLERTYDFNVPSVQNGPFFTENKVVTMSSLLDMAKNLVGVSDIVNEMIESFNMPSIFFDSTEDKISLSGYWTTESDIPELNEGSFSFLFGMSFFGNGDNYIIVHNNFKNDQPYYDGAENIYISETFGNKYESKSGNLTINEILSVSEECVVLDVEYGMDNTTIIRSGTLTLTKQGDGMVNTMEHFVKNNVPLYALLTFNTDGEIKCWLKAENVAEIDMVIGHYSLQNDKIVIEVDTDTLTAAGVDLGELKARAGMVLTFANDEIMLFEKFDETGRPINFGLKLTDVE